MSLSRAAFAEDIEYMVDTLGVDEHTVELDDAYLQSPLSDSEDVEYTVDASLLSFITDIGEPGFLFLKLEDSAVEVISPQRLVELLLNSKTRNKRVLRAASSSSMLVSQTRESHPGPLLLKTSLISSKILQTRHMEDLCCQMQCNTSKSVIMVSILTRPVKNSDSSMSNGMSKQSKSS